MIIRNLNTKEVVLSSGEKFSPPPNHKLDYADSTEGIYSFRSEKGHWERRRNQSTGEVYQEFIPHSYSVRLDQIKIK